ncbi:chemotaxis protein CheC [Candidatus Woesearchaeota archaeon]|nr:chemotaxis protein CheC [Candidatus Woesearchaeota archaeon]
MDKTLKMDQYEMDALTEVGNVGVGNATTALSKLLDKRVAINIPETKFVAVERFADELGGAEQTVVTVYLQVTGDLNGEVIFIFPRKGAMELVDLIMNKSPGTTKLMEAMEESAFKEMANIFTSSYLNALAKMFDMKIIHSVPHLAIDMAQAIIDFVLIKLSQTADNLLCVKTNISIEKHNIDGTFMILFDKESLSRIINLLKSQYKI